ncbi:MAG: NAD kinase [Luteibaculaceae bacterium]
MNVAIYGKRVSLKQAELLHGIIQYMIKQGFTVKCNMPFYDHLFCEHRLPLLADVTTYASVLKGDENFLLAAGGDGTILETARVIRDLKIPVLGINTGRMGFLSDISMDDAIQTIKLVEKREYQIEARSLLELESGGNLGELSNFPFALNEITVLKKDSSSMISVHTYIDDHFFCTFWADGLIVSTPTGSTAYNLSCGGPIVEPSSNSIIITPISPHNLSARPVVLNNNRKVKLKLEGREDQFLLTLDSRSQVLFKEEDIVIKKADFTIDLIKLNNHSFYDTLRTKLNFGYDKRN